MRARRQATSETLACDCKRPTPVQWFQRHSSKTTSTWKLQRAPPKWKQTDVVSVLEGAGWKDVQILAAPRRRLGRLSKGICPGDGSTMLEAIEAGSVEVYRFSLSSAHRRATSRHAASFGRGHNRFAEATPGEAENMEVRWRLRCLTKAKMKT